MPAVLGADRARAHRGPPGAPRPHEEPGAALALAEPGLQALPRAGRLFALGYYSLGFLLMQAHALGFGVSGVVLLYALFNTTCVIAAPLAGRLGDRIGRRRIVLLGYALYGLVNLGMVFADAAAGSWSRCSRCTACSTRSRNRRAAPSSPTSSRSGAPPRSACTTSVTGALYLPASLIAGALWTVSPAAAFGLAAALSLAAIASFAGFVGWMPAAAASCSKR